MRGRRVFESDPAPPAEYGAGRICGHEGCDTILRRTNPLPFCTLHERDWYTPESLDMVYNENGERQCQGCGRFLPPYAAFWFSEERSPDGLGVQCKTCLAGDGNPRIVGEEERKKRERVAARARQLRYYYKKKHGMTREEWRGRNDD